MAALISSRRAMLMVTNFFSWSRVSFSGEMNWLPTMTPLSWPSSAMSAQMSLVVGVPAAGVGAAEVTTVDGATDGSGPAAGGSAELPQPAAARRTMTARIRLGLMARR